MKTIKILGIPFAAVLPDEALDILEGWVCESVSEPASESRNHCVVTPNPEGVMQASRNPAFREALLGADLSLADGIGIIMAAKLLKTPLPGRVRGVDTCFALFERMNAKQPFTAYFLGGQPTVAEAAKEKMQARFPRLSVVGFHHGFFSAEDEAGIIEEINSLSPDILLVCTGMPRAEMWAERNRGINAKVTLSVGGTLDIMAGAVKLAPPVFRKIGLEWVYRLVTQPSRAKRMLDIPRFIFAVFWKGSNYES